MNHFKKILTTTAAAGLLLISIAAVGAQDAPTPTAPTAETQQGGRFGFGQGQRGGRFGLGGNGELRALVEEYTGLSGQDLREAVQGGQTVAQLIEANGRSVEEFTNAAVTQIETEIDERAAEMKANARDRVTALINGERPQRPADGSGE
ncbi:MAG: hypothetical protein ACOYL5_16460 [Phototrophicaceae bacterium]|jgi:hypothetical protein